MSKFLSILRYYQAMNLLTKCAAQLSKFDSDPQDLPLVLFISATRPGGGLRCDLRQTA